MNTTGLLGDKGINVNVGIDQNDLIILVIGVFGAIVLGGVVVKLITKSF